jgi:Trk-type K+ transport system membrane component|tara:strand:- start:1688 stop:3508 length:1821 start_codon:yes stop_codon:yes gene_type:complete
MGSGLQQRINQIREWVNLRIYDSKPGVLLWLRRISIPLSFTSVAALMAYHGFQLNDAQELLVELLLKGTIAFYLIKYLIQLFFSFSPWQDIKERRWEALFMVSMALYILAVNLFDEHIIESFGQTLGLDSLEALFMIFVQGYFLLFVALEIGKASRFLPKVGMNPAGMLVISFVSLAVVGTGLLAMPEMSTTEGSIPLMDALFTSVSAVSVTGLNVMDITSILSFKGQFVLMVLIQLGGLNFITFASMLALLANPSMGRRVGSLMQSSGSSGGGGILVKQIIRFSLFFEAITMVLLYFSWGDYPFEHWGDKVFFSAFHAVSAFTNAGFSLMPEGLANPLLTNNTAFVVIIGFSVIFGALGFTTIHDLFSSQATRNRRKNPWTHLTINTKIALYATIILIPIGALLFALLESNGVLVGMSWAERSLTALFQSVTLRSAGFNTVDIGALTTPTLIIAIIFMFIGGSSGSTAGGIKTSTFTLVFLNAMATIRGQKRVEFSRTTIPTELLNMASSIFLFSASSIFLGVLLLSITDGHLSLEQLAFEEVSAFCTLGWSTGITEELSEMGRIILISSMFIGRIGTVTLAFALTRGKKASAKYSYPKASVQVG